MYLQVFRLTTQEDPPMVSGAVNTKLYTPPYEISTVRIYLLSLTSKKVQNLGRRRRRLGDFESFFRLQVQNTGLRIVETKRTRSETHLETHVQFNRHTNWLFLPLSPLSVLKHPFLFIITVYELHEIRPRLMCIF